jgi:hypothetical protein
MTGPLLLRRWRAVRAASLAAVVLPIVVATIRALANGWYPMGDNALFALRARDVLTSHHPLLGAWSSASLSREIDINNPGPLFFDVLAVPSKIWPTSGPVIGTVVLHLAMVLLAAWFAARRGRAPSVLVLAMAAALVWTMGSTVLVEPWQPHSLLLVFLCFLVLTWAMCCGDALALPWAVAVGSLLVQTHASYTTLVAGLGALAVGMLAWRYGGARRGEPGEGTQRGVPPSRLLVAVTVLVAAVLWVQPVADQVAGTGNLGDLVRSTAGGTEEQVGIGAAAQVVAGTVAVPPAWARPGFGTYLDAPAGVRQRPEEMPGTPSGGAAVVGLVLLSMALVGAALVASRRGDREAALAVLVASVGLVLSVLTVAIIPVGPLGFGAHFVRWLWPISIFTTGALAFGLLRRRWLLPGSLAGLAVLAVLAVPAHREGTGPSAGPSTTEADFMSSWQELLPQLDALDGRGPLLVEIDGLRLFEPYSSPLMLELDRRGIDFVVDHRFTVRQVGEGRRYRPGSVDWAVYVLDGRGASEPRPGADRVAFVRGADGRPDIGVFIRPVADR